MIINVLFWPSTQHMQEMKTLKIPTLDPASVRETGRCLVASFVYQPMNKKGCSRLTNDEAERVKTVSRCISKTDVTEASKQRTSRWPETREETHAHTTISGAGSRGEVMEAKARSS